MARPISWTTISIGTALLITVAATGIALGTRSASSNVSPELEQPSSWVSFKARVHVFKPGRPTAVGVFYRNGDGSSRLETGPEDGSVTVISIRHIPSSTYYVRGANGKW